MQPADIKKYCDLLEIGPEADIEQVNRAYRDLAAVWHPDRFAGNRRLAERAGERLKALNVARTALIRHLEQRQFSPPRHRPSSPKTPRATTPKPIVDHPRPLLRCLARSIDYALFGLFIVYADLETGLAATPATLLCYPLAIGFLWIFFEAGFLTTTGATPGKWMIRTEIVSRSLRPPTYAEALRRSLKVWFYGSGACLLPLSALTAAGSCYYLIKRKYTPWDAAEGFFITHRRVGARWVVLFITTVVLVYLYQPFLLKQATAVQQRIPALTGAAIVPSPPPGQPPPVDSAEELMHRAVRLIEKGRYPRAVEVLAQAASLQPGTARVHFLTGFARAKQGLHHQAVRELRRAINLDPAFARAYHTLGLVYLNLEDRGLAMEQYRALQRIDAALAEELLRYIRGSHPPPSDTRWTHDFFLSSGSHVPCDSV